ncbi:uncharacterized protein BDV17DRAFT_49706 [Aspergillus undulatus]|uniref:uncharacterized protein n=1 Tax=Aspergillus undulatus TaxID=1810928 RepID=UPI003CCE0822
MEWRTYQFVIVIYNDWAPDHREMLRSAIDNLPDRNQMDMLPDEDDPPLDKKDYPSLSCDNPAVDDPKVPNVDLSMLDELAKDYVEALGEAGLSRSLFLRRTMNDAAPENGNTAPQTAAQS